MQVISFDFGTKKIGVAVGQTETKTSSPLQIVFSKNNSVNWDEIESIVNEWKPNLILVGKPLNMDGSDSDMMEKVDIFYSPVGSKSSPPIPITLVINPVRRILVTLYPSPNWVHESKSSSTIWKLNA